MQDGWLKCRVMRGCFSDERGIAFRWKNGREDEAWVPAASVRGENNQMGAVRVKLYVVNGVEWAMLPTDYSDSIVPDPSDVERELVEA